MSSLNLPSTLRELNILTFDVARAAITAAGTCPAYPPFEGEIVLIGDLTATSVVNTNGNLVVAGRTLTLILPTTGALKNIGPVAPDEIWTGYIDLTNGSTGDFTAYPAAAHPAIKHDETTNLIMRD